MSCYPPPELMSKEDRIAMAIDLGLAPDYFESELNMNKVFESGGKKISMREWKAQRDAAK